MEFSTVINIAYSNNKGSHLNITMPSTMPFFLMEASLHIAKCVIYYKDADIFEKGNMCQATAINKLHFTNFHLQRRNDEEPSKITSCGDLVLKDKSEDDSQNRLLGSLATIACYVMHPTKDVQTNDQLVESMVFLVSQLMITHKMNKQEHLFVHDVIDLPTPTSKIKDNNTSADKSNTSNTKPTRTSSWIEENVKDKEAKKEPDKKTPKQTLSSKQKKSLTATKAASLGSPVILSLVPPHTPYKSTFQEQN